MPPIRVHGEKRGQFETQRASKPPKQHTPWSVASTWSVNPHRMGKASSPRVLSPLERLPTEVLEIVFFNCLNINLPRASPVLASALSSFHVKSHLFFRVFTDYHRQSRRLLSIPLTWREVSNLRESISKLKWMTLDFLHQCIPILLEKVWLEDVIVRELGGTDNLPASYLTNETATKFLADTHQATRFEESHRQFYLSRTAQWWYGHKNLFIGTGLPDGRISVYSTRSNPIFIQSYVTLFGLSSNPWKLLRRDSNDDEIQRTILLRNTHNFADIKADTV